MALDGRPFARIRLRARPTRERGRPARTINGTTEQIPVKAGLAHRARKQPWIGGRLHAKGCEPDPPGNAGVPPAPQVARRNRTPLRPVWRAVRGSSPGSEAVCTHKPASQTYPGTRASRPHHKWHDGTDPRKGRFGAPCEGVALVGRPFARKRLRARPTRERGRPARTISGTTDQIPATAGLARHAREWPWIGGRLHAKGCEPDPPGNAGVPPAPKVPRRNRTP